MAVSYTSRPLSAQNRKYMEKRTRRNLQNFRQVFGGPGIENE